MRGVVISGGRLADAADAAASVMKDDMVICADSGYLHALAMGLKPQAVLGDFDSVERDAVVCETIISYPAHKDQTDTELCVRYAIARGCDEILLLGATGGRIDHELANVFLLKLISDAGKKGSIYDGVSYVFLVADELILTGDVGDILSVIPVTAQVVGITTRGLAYPLDNACMAFGPALGISNVFSESRAEVKIKEGLALVVWTKADKL